METNRYKASAALRSLQKQLKTADLCLVNRNNEQLFSTYNHNENDLFHLIGFEGSAGILTLRKQDIILWVDRRYLKVAKAQYLDSQVQVREQRHSSWLQEFLKPWSQRYRGRGGARIFIDRSKWSHHDIEVMIAEIESSTWEHKSFSPRTEVNVDREIDFPKQINPKEQLQRLQHHLKPCEAMLLSCADDIAWATCTRANDYDYRRNLKAMALICHHEAFLFSTLTPELSKRFQQERPCWKVLPKQEAWINAIKTLIDRKKLTKVYTANHHRPGAICSQHMKQLIATGCNIVSQSRSLAELGRLEKQDAEISNMKRSQKKLAFLMGQIRSYLHSQIKNKRQLSEIDLADKIQQLAIPIGANRPCFPPIVASGPNSCHPHHTPTQRIIQKGEPVLIDIGYYFDDALYATDMTRTFLSDNLSRPHPLLINVYTAVLKAFLAQYFYPITTDSTASDLDAVGRDLLKPWEDIGFYFIHGTGHGVGISDHELGLTIGEQSNLTLRPRLCYTLEPGVYLQGESTLPSKPTFGVRLEDVVFVEQNGEHQQHQSLAAYPFEKCLIDLDQFSSQEKALLDRYHQLCRKTVKQH